MILALATALIWTGCEKDDSKEDSPQLKPYVVSRETRTENSSWVFNYDTWFDQTDITIISNNGNKKTVPLPWAGVVSTSMPIDYKHPEKEFLADGKTRRWELAFNVCEDEKKNDGINIFGLWDAYSQTMRVYCYLNELPNANASSCFYQIQSSADNYLDPDAKMWMPSDSIFHSSNWKGTISSGLPVPSKTGGRILPVTGTLDGQVNKGWLCFDLHFGSGISTVKNNDIISLTLYGVQNLIFTGNIDVQGALNNTKGSITMPGNKTRVASGWIKAFGSLIHDIGESLSWGENATSIFGLAGAGINMIGNAIDATDEGEESKYKLELGFNMTATGEINGSLNSTLGTNIQPAEFDYEYFFEEILNHYGKFGTKELTMGVWNLKNQPVIYVADDFHFVGNEKYYASFLDPTSLEIILNGDNLLFPSSKVERVSMRVNDFAFISSKYDVPSLPYYDFYGIKTETFDGSKQDRIHFKANVDQFRLKEGASIDYVGIIRNNKAYSYSGEITKLDEYGMDAYNVVYSPIVSYRDANELWFGNIDFNDLYVAVCIKVDFDNGHSQFFAERFLPIIKRFSFSDVPNLRERLSKAAAPESVNGIPIEMPNFDLQRDKAVRMLDAAYRVDKYPDVFVKEKGNKVIYGLRVRKWSKDAPGLVFVTGDKYTTTPEESYLDTMKYLHDYLTTLNDWACIDNRLMDMGLPTLDQPFWAKSPYKVTFYNIRTGEEMAYGSVSDDVRNNALSLNLYYEDKDGKLTLVTPNNL